MASVATTMDTVPNTNVSKRQACDECRSRKLACTKEATGCSRCIRKKVPCHYSEQKPMGRPRKRQCPEENADKHVTVLDLGPDSMNPNFEDSVSVDVGFGGATEATLPLGVADNLRHENAFTVKEDGRLVWHFGDRDMMPIIDFTHTQDDSAPDTVPELDNTPRDTPPDLNLWPGFEHNIHTPQEKCSCLASLYLALASLQDLPNTIPPAIATVRRATLSAQVAVNCPQCAGTDLPVDMAYGAMPPLQGFQTFMMLGTLIPVIADGYKRIIQMVDCEANSASLMGMKMSLKQEDYEIPPEMGDCSECCPADNLDTNNMTPSTWRTTLRAMLRWDVYGSDEMMPIIGLKGVVVQMENTCNERHKIVERMREELQLDPNLPPATSEKDRLCTKVLEAAKLAMKELIIP